MRQVSASNYQPITIRTYSCQTASPPININNGSGRSVFIILRRHKSLRFIQFSFTLRSNHFQTFFLCLFFFYSCFGAARFLFSLCSYSVVLQFFTPVCERSSEINSKQNFARRSRRINTYDLFLDKDDEHRWDRCARRTAGRTANDQCGRTRKLHCPIVNTPLICVLLSETQISLSFRTNYLAGNRDLAVRFDDAAYNRSAGKLVRQSFVFLWLEIICGLFAGGLSTCSARTAATKKSTTATTTTTSATAVDDEPTRTNASTAAAAAAAATTTAYVHANSANADDGNAGTTPTTAAAAADPPASLQHARANATIVINPSSSEPHNECKTGTTSTSIEYSIENTNTELPDATATDKAGINGTFHSAAAAAATTTTTASAAATATSATSATAAASPTTATTTGATSSTATAAAADASTAVSSSPIAVHASPAATAATTRLSTSFSTNAQSSTTNASSGNSQKLAQINPIHWTCLASSTSTSTEPSQSTTTAATGFLQSRSIANTANARLICNTTRLIDEQRRTIFINTGSFYIIGQYRWK